MNFLEEIKGMLKEEAIRRNKDRKILIFTFLVLSIVSLPPLLLVGNIFPVTDTTGFLPFFLDRLYYLSFLFLFASVFLSMALPAKIILDENSINQWFMSLRMNDLLLNKVESLVIEKWKSKRESNILKEYGADINEDDKELLLFLLAMKLEKDLYSTKF